MWDPAIVHELHGFKEAESVAPALGVVMLSFVVKRAEDLEPAFASMIRDGVNGVFVFPNSITTPYGRRVAELALKHRLPAIFGVRETAEVGGLLSYGPVRTENYRRVAGFVNQVLRGAQPADLPIQQPTKFEFVINLKTAKALGLTIPQSLLLRADQVIE
jgi:putative ABC transport system substrate-binding protein